MCPPPLFKFKVERSARAAGREDLRGGAHTRPITTPPSRECIDEEMRDRLKIDLSGMHARRGSSHNDAHLQGRVHVREEVCA